MSATDPVEVLAAEVRDLWDTAAGRGPGHPVTQVHRELARSMLTKVSVQDWRIVRLVSHDEFAETLAVDTAADVDPFDVPCWVVVAEWEPVG